MEKRKRVLVVDDESLVHSAVRIGLRGEFDIVGKMSAEEALLDLEGELEEGRFDLVLLDVFMPGIPDGVDFFRRLERIDPANAPAVLFMTGDPHIAGVLNARVTCLAKPFAGEELRRTIANVLAQRATPQLRTAT